MARIGYARVSSIDQDLESQLDRLKAEGCGVIGSEKVSGASRDGRPELETIIQFLGPGDELLVTRLDRLGRDTRDVLNIIHEADQRQAFVTVLDPHVTTRGETGRIVMTVLGMVAQMERRFIKERQREGIERAKADGLYRGGKRRLNREKVQSMNAAGVGPTAMPLPWGARECRSIGFWVVHYARTFRRLLRQADLGEIAAAWDALARQASAQLAVEGFTGNRARLKRSAALHYQGQSYELTVSLPEGPIDADMVAHLEEAFGQEHERTYGHRAGTEEPVELVAIQLVGSGLRRGGEVPARVTSSRTEPAEQDARQAYFGEEHGWMDTPVLRRADLAITPRRVGPLIVEEYDATCLIPPRAHAEFDNTGNIVIEL